MQDRRRAEIQAKREKLAALREASEIRKQRRTAELNTPSKDKERDRVLRDVHTLTAGFTPGVGSSIGDETPISSAPSTPAQNYPMALPLHVGAASGRISRMSDGGSDSKGLGIQNGLNGLNGHDMET